MFVAPILSVKVLFVQKFLFSFFAWINEQNYFILFMRKASETEYNSEPYTEVLISLKEQVVDSWMTYLNFTVETWEILITIWTTLIISWILPIFLWGDGRDLRCCRLWDRFGNDWYFNPKAEFNWDLNSYLQWKVFGWMEVQTRIILNMKQIWLRYIMRNVKQTYVAVPRG